MDHIAGVIIKLLAIALLLIRRLLILILHSRTAVALLARGGRCDTLAILAIAVTVLGITITALNGIAATIGIICHDTFSLPGLHHGSTA